MPWNLPVPTFSGDAGVRELVATMRQPAYVKLLGKAAGAAFGTGLIVRRLPPQVAMPMVLMTGIYIGLEMAAWMEEEAVSHKGPVIDATASVPVEAAVAAGYDLPATVAESGDLSLSRKSVRPEGDD